MTYVLNHWNVDVEKDDEGESYVVYHYVGGEDPYFVADYFDDREEARAKVRELNSHGITIEWSVHEDNATCTLYDPVTKETL